MEQISETSFKFWEGIGYPRPPFITWVMDNYQFHEYTIKDLGSSLHVVECVLTFRKIEDAMAFKLRWMGD